MAIGTFMIIATIALTSITVSTVFAQTAPAPNTVGKANQQRNEDFRNAGDPSGTGQHASDPTGQGPSSPTTVNCSPGDPGRCGLALNRANGGDPTGSPQQTICLVTGNTATGCP
jgi:hypothetical protein